MYHELKFDEKEQANITQGDMQQLIKEMKDGSNN